jgi:hypothetical protein
MPKHLLRLPRFQAGLLQELAAPAQVLGQRRV